LAAASSTPVSTSSVSGRTPRRASHLIGIGIGATRGGLSNRDEAKAMPGRDALDQHARRERIRRQGLVRGIIGQERSEIFTVMLIASSV
jgi:hypothetical protein